MVIDESIEDDFIFSLKDGVSFLESLKIGEIDICLAFVVFCGYIVCYQGIDSCIFEIFILDIHFFFCVFYAGRGRCKYGFQIRYLLVYSSISLVCFDIITFQEFYMFIECLGSICGLVEKSYDIGFENIYV